MSASKPWLAMTPEQRISEVRLLLEQGHAPGTIAWKLRARPSAITSVVRAIRKADGAPHVEVSPPAIPDAPLRWEVLTSEERDAAVLALRAEGLSASQVADRLATTRNAIVGYMHRMTEAGVDVPGRKSPKRSRAAKAPVPPKMARQAVAPKQAPKRDKVLRKSAAGSVEVAPMRGPNNPHPFDFKARAEQRASSPGLAPALIAGVPMRPVDDDTAPESKRLALVELTATTCRWPSGDPRAEDFGFCGHDVSDSPYCPYHKRLAHEPPTTRQRAEIRSAERKFA